MKKLITATALTAAAMWAVEATADISFGEYYLKKHAEVAAVMDTQRCADTLRYIEQVELADAYALEALSASANPDPELAHALSIYMRVDDSGDIGPMAAGALCGYYLGRAYGVMEAMYEAQEDGIDVGRMLTDTLSK